MFYHASRIDGAGFDELINEPARLTRALIEQHRFFDTDTVCVRFDEAVFATATGVTVDWSDPVPSLTAASVDPSNWLTSSQQALDSVAPLIDVIGRIVAELRGDVPIMAVLPTPRRIMTPAGAAADETRGVQIIRELTDQVCKAGCRIVELVAGEVETDTASSMASIVNTARYFNAFTILDSEAVPEKRTVDAIVTDDNHLTAAQDNKDRCVLRVPRACLEDNAVCAEFVHAIEAAPFPVALTIDDAATGDVSTERIAVLHRQLAEISFSEASQ
jgi:hypothetical protein